MWQRGREEKATLGAFFYARGEPFIHPNWRVGAGGVAGSRTIKHV